MKRPARLQPNPKSVSSRRTEGAALKGDPTFIDCREKLIRAFPPLKASDTLPRSSTVLGKLECYFWHKSPVCGQIFGIRKIDINDLIFIEKITERCILKDVIFGFQITLL